MFTKIVIPAYGGPQVLKIVQETELPRPASGEVRLKMLATSACFTDLLVIAGQYPDVKQKPPLSPGYDIVGRVDAVADDVHTLQVGQLVAAMPQFSAYQDYLCLSEKELVPVPDDLDPAEAVSMVLSYLTAYQMLHRVAKVEAGQKILVHGAGGAVGTALLQLGRLAGLEMYGTASAEKHVLVKASGAVPIDYRNEDFVAHLAEIAPQGMHAVFDGIGGDYYSRSFKTLRRGGELVAYGFYNTAMGRGGSIPLEFMRIIAMNVLPNGKAARFYSINGLKEKHPDWFRQDLMLLFTLLQAGKIQPEIARRMPLRQAVEALTLVKQAAVKGKIVLLGAQD
ncbi:MAG: medium chain dehydrogenase/reductase family protein [Anaerolineaceae bacterium]|nr:medium chain dehydrogenase/reductase family protein [Anaerolineaceae bacterium]